MPTNPVAPRFHLTRPSHVLAMARIPACARIGELRRRDPSQSLAPLIRPEPLLAP